MPSVTTWTKMYKYKWLNRIARWAVLRKGADIPQRVQIGSGVTFPHNALGTVIHPATILEDDVKVYQNVTIGRGDIWKPYDKSNELSFRIKKGAVLCAGCKVIASKGQLAVGKNTIIAANAVLLQSTGDNEVWGGTRSQVKGFVNESFARHLFT